MLQITYRHMTSSDSVHDLASEKFAKISEYFDESTRCHLVVDCCSGHARKEEQFVAHVELVVGAADLRIDATAAHELAATAVRKAFEHIERQVASRHGRGLLHLRVS